MAWMLQNEAQIRPLSPSDYDRVIAVVDDWWGGRQVAGKLRKQTGSLPGFHRSMGFEVERGNAERDGIPFTRDYDGPGQDRVRFVKDLSGGHS